VTSALKWLQEFIVDQNLLTHINGMLAELEQKAIMCKQLNYKSGFALLPVT